MNRYQKRKLIKNLKKYGLTLEDYLRLIDLNDDETLPEGIKVKLRYDTIMEDKEKLSENFLAWVTEHKDKIMTVEYDKEIERKVTYLLKEDKSEPKWVFWKGYLEVVE